MLSAPAGMSNLVPDSPSDDGVDGNTSSNLKKKNSITCLQWGVGQGQQTLVFLNKS